MINISQIAVSAFIKWASVTPNLLSSIGFSDDHTLEILADFEGAIANALRAADKKYGNPPGDIFEMAMAYGFVEGYVKGNMSVCWSYRYLPPKPYMDYQLWILSFKNYLAIDRETRLRVNRLYSFYKENYSSIGSGVFGKNFQIDTEELHMHHIVSDIKADLNWENFEKLFDVFFEEDVVRALSDRSLVEFSNTERLFTPDELAYIYHNRK